MKTFIKITLITLLVSACFECRPRQRRHIHVTYVQPRKWVQDGWSCPFSADKFRSPFSLKCKKKDFLYMLFKANATQKAIESGRLAQMLATCREDALLQMKGADFPKILGAYIERAYPLANGDLYARGIIASGKNKIKAVGRYDCCALNLDTGGCIKRGKRENWAQCLCLGYMKYKGGNKPFEKALHKIRGQ